MRVHAEVCHDNGIASVHYSPQGYCLYTGGEKGEIGMFDLRMMRMVEVSLRPNCPPSLRGAWVLRYWRCVCQTFQAHESAVQSISVSKDQRHIYTGSKDGTLKVRQSICFPLLGLALTICLLARCGSRVRLRPQSSRSRTRTCGTPVREQFPRFVTLGAPVL